MGNEPIKRDNEEDEDSAYQQEDDMEDWHNALWSRDVRVHR